MMFSTQYAILWSSLGVKNGFIMTINVIRAVSYNLGWRGGADLKRLTGWWIYSVHQTIDAIDRKTKKKLHQKKHMECKIKPVFIVPLKINLHPFTVARRGRGFVEWKRRRGSRKGRLWFDWWSREHVLTIDLTRDIYTGWPELRLHPSALFLASSTAHLGIA